MIYFDNNKEAHAYETEGYIASVDIETWRMYADTDAGIGWDIVDGVFTPLKQADEIQNESLRLERESERGMLYTYADEQIAKCDNYILLDIEGVK